MPSFLKPRHRWVHGGTRPSCGNCGGFPMISIHASADTKLSVGYLKNECDFSYPVEKSQNKVLFH